MADPLREIEIFVRVADAGGLSRAARSLNLSQPTISRLLADLEARIGVKLLLRTTRQLALTESGAIYLQRVRPILAALDEARAAASGASGLSGILRVVMPVAFGTREIIPRLGEFLAGNPDLRIELLMADQTQDLVAEGADLALRLGALRDSSFVSRHVASSPRFVVAAPAYLRRVGAPVDPAELSARECIIGPGGSSQDTWGFRAADGTPVTVEVHGRLRVTSAEAVVAAARAGLGFALASRWMCGSELAAGALVPVLATYALEPATVHAVYPAGRSPPPKARAFAGWAAVSLAGARD